MKQKTVPINDWMITGLYRYLRKFGHVWQDSPAIGLAGRSLAVHHGSCNSGSRDLVQVLALKFSTHSNIHHTLDHSLGAPKRAEKQSNQLQIGTGKQHKHDCCKKSKANILAPVPASCLARPLATPGRKKAAACGHRTKHMRYVSSCCSG